ncbi:hypothetical protein N7474_004713 [Penicillium riverlandense]|uniref:uncharacterized protein n=1 Tax=Penicillium riverlandense TaxID=1903569 RepID=UPI0025468D62|nr:uncharacterized protein N7474_004713 [Penicillium riverlandense]KAJ5819122.1 hypothetical protein N7474_004713 [Penicillium riverlandense]
MANTNDSSLLPPIESPWKARIQSNKLINPTIHTLSPMKSGSKLGEEQFLQLRVLWPPLIVIDDFEVGPKRFKVKADDVMKELVPFAAYLKHIQGNKTHIQPYKKGRWADNRGVEFRDVRPQRNIARPDYAESDSLSRESSGPQDIQMRDSVSNTSAAAEMRDVRWTPTRDEQIVNTALLEYLNALTVNIPEVQCDWSSARLAFKAEFGQAHMEARTDGFLKGEGMEEAFAILEVKPRVRDREGDPAIQYQESAQMVGWILHDEKNTRKVALPKRLIISQDRNEIYITEASYKDEYVQHLKDKDAEPAGFLTMQEYGPWNIDDHKHMRHLAKIVVRFCIEVSDLIKEATSSR